MPCTKVTPAKLTTFKLLLYSDICGLFTNSYSECPIVILVKILIYYQPHPGDEVLLINYFKLIYCLPVLYHMPGLRSHLVARHSLLMSSIFLYNL